MTPEDAAWVHSLLPHLEGPVLELGVGYGGDTCRDIIRSAGLDYFGTDVEKTPGVDFVANFERAEDMGAFDHVAPFGSVLVLNVLEHTFDPIRVLDNAIALLKPGGLCAVLTPAIWPLHNFPMDAWRILPNFYEEYAKRRGLRMLGEFFQYVAHGPVGNFTAKDGSYAFPPPTLNRFAYWKSRIVHRVFNTFGRGMCQPSHVAAGAVMQRL